MANSSLVRSWNVRHSFTLCNFLRALGARISISGTKENVIVIKLRVRMRQRRSHMHTHTHESATNPPPRRAIKCRFAIPDEIYSDAAIRLTKICGFIFRFDEQWTDRRSLPRERLNKRTRGDGDVDFEMPEACKSC